MTSRGYALQDADSRDLPEMCEISAAAHQANYGGVIPDGRWKDFWRHYQTTPRNLQRFVEVGTERMRDNSYQTVKAIDPAGEIAGYLSIQHHKTQPSEIRSIFVRPEHQGRGIGSMLMEYTLERYGKNPINLYVVAGNEKAIKLYKNYGFEVINIIPDRTFYGAPLIHMNRGGVA